MVTVKPEKLIYGISTSVLFDMGELDRIYREEGRKAYIDHMLKHADDPLPLGPGFDHIRYAFESPEFVETVIASRNSPLTAHRSLITLLDQGITPGRMFFTAGKSPVPFLKAYGIDDFSTTNKGDAQAASSLGVLSTFYDLQNGGVVSNPPPEAEKDTKKGADVIDLGGRKQKKAASLKEIWSGKPKAHHVFDLDGVIFGPESEEFFQAHGLEAYQNFERALQNQPMSQGPAFNKFRKLYEINNQFGGTGKPFGIHIETARGYSSAIRAIETLHRWGMDVEGTTHFLAGTPKGPVLEVLRQQAQEAGCGIRFYDDQVKNIEQGRAAGVLSGLVIQPERPVDPAA